MDWLHLPGAGMEDAGLWALYLLPLSVSDTGQRGSPGLCSELALTGPHLRPDPKARTSVPQGQYDRLSCGGCLMHRVMARCLPLREPGDPTVSQLCCEPAEARSVLGWQEEDTCRGLTGYLEQ